jgi:cellular nucleic acid-binding protein
LENHFTSNGSEWTKVYKPISILELKPNCDDYDEDKITKQYMDKYGIDNVRGGSFVSINIEKSTRDVLKQMNNGTNNKCFTCGANGHFSKDCTKRFYKQNQNAFVNNKNSPCMIEFLYDYYESDDDDCEQMEYIAPKQNNVIIVKQNNFAKQDNNNIKCFRCGRKGHYSTTCYAHKNINGKYL